MIIKALNNNLALSQHAQLLDSCFPIPPGSSFFEDFPIWNPKFALKNVMTLGLFVNDQLIASAGLRKGERGDTRKLQLGMIGAVATLPEFRGKGLASSLIQALLEEAENQKLDLVILWGSERSLYKKFGFKLCGEQFTVPLWAIPPVPFEAFQFHRGWTPALFDKLQETSERLQLSAEDRPWFEAHKNVLWYYSGDVNSPKAYAALGRGIDLNSVIHEWGGEKTHLLPLFSYLKTLHPEASVMGSRPLLNTLGISVENFPLQYLCMAKALNPEALRAFFGESFDPEKLLPPDFWIWGLDAC